MRPRRYAMLTALALLAGAAPAPAFVWPNTIEQIEKQLRRDDVTARRRAARKLAELPLPAAQRLVPKALGDADLEVRLAAADAALELGLEGVGDALVAWLVDPERRIRLAAAELLRQSPTPRALGPLGRLLGDPDASVRSAAAAALGASGQADAVLPLLGHLDDAVPEVRRDVVMALARLGDARAVVPLIGKVQDARPVVRRAVARALGQLGDRRATSALVLALRDADESVRIAALAALGELGDDGTTLAISALVREDSREPVRAAALDALGRIASPAALDVLVGALGSAELAALRPAIRRSLGRAGEPALERLRQCLVGQPARSLADGCTQALGDTRAPKAAAWISDALRRGVVGVESALPALAEIGDRSALPTVLEHITDDDPVARRAAIDAAHTLLDPMRPDGRAVEPIALAFEAARARRAERAALAALLGRTGSPRARKVLEPLAKNTDDIALRVVALEALGLLGPAGQDATLLDALDDEHASVRLAAALALRRSAAGASARALLDRLELAAEQDRLAVTIALGGALARAVDPAAVERSERLVRVRRDGERDGLIEAIGRAPSAQGLSPLVQLAERSPHLADRAKVAEALAAHRQAVPALRKLATDVDGAVRANAIWALGSAGTKDEIALVRNALADRDVAVAGNAAAALGRLSARAKVSAGDALCAALADRRSYVRANALAALRVAGERCDPAKARDLLRRDRAEVVREAAARLLASVPAAKGRDQDRSALETCVDEDPSGRVAAACSEPPLRAADGGEPVTVFVVPTGEAAPVPRAPFALVRADGLVRLGVTDRRGAVFEHDAPRGYVTLTVPAPLAK